MVSPEEIEQLLGDIESFRVERTQSLNDTDKFCKAICAFANDLAGSGLAGYLFAGVDTRGEPTEDNIDERVLEALASHRSNGQIVPMPSMVVFKQEYEGKPIAVVEVQPSDMPPVRYKGRCWVRVGPSAHVATLAEEQRLSERRIDRARTWDLQACIDATCDDLAVDLFRLSYLPQAVSREALEENNRTLEEQLGSLRFFHRGIGSPTNGAVVVLGKDPESFFPGAYVQYVRYEGTEQSSEVRTERRINGDLLQVMRTLDRMAEDLENARPVRRDDLSESLAADYPKLALHELFVNAVVHRNYEGSTTPVAINQYADRIEISNPGSLYGDLTADQFPAGTSYRNPVLAEAAKVLGFANRFGRGIALAKNALAKNGSPDVEFVVGENHMLVVVRKRP